MNINTLTKDVKLELLYRLKQIVNTRSSRRPAWFVDSFGLCSNFDLMCDKYFHNWVCGYNPFNRLFIQYIETWPKYSGDKIYYIPASPSKHQHQAATAAMAYDWYDNQYDRRIPYCRLRHELLDHVIACVEAETA